MANTNYISLITPTYDTRSILLHLQGQSEQPLVYNLNSTEARNQYKLRCKPPKTKPNLTCTAINAYTGQEIGKLQEIVIKRQPNDVIY